MKRFVILFALLFAAFSMATAQDRITTKRGEDIQAKVQEVGIYAVKYVKSSNPHGPVYTLPKEDILMILYENGEKDVFYFTPARVYSASAPLREGMSYNQYKKLYNKRDYERHYDDPYDPFLAGLGSYLLPGLGQCICGEWGRGLAFCLGTYLTVGMATAGAAGEYSYSYDGQGHRVAYDSDYAFVPLLLATGAMWIWNICDAVKVAKIKNMYFQDVYGRGHELKLHIDPYVGFSPAAAGPDTKLAGGLSLKLDF